MPADNTQLRSRPHQARSRATFQRILETAAILLDEVGWEGFNNNLLAERSGHRPAAIYRYFPNKLAIVSALAEQHLGEWNERLEGFDRQLEGSADLTEAWSYFVRRFPDFVKSQRGGVAVRRAMQASPTLRDIDQRDNAHIASVLASSLGRVMPHLDAGEAATASRLLLESAVSILDHAVEAKPAETQRMIDELLIMHATYFDQLRSRRKPT